MLFNDEGIELDAWKSQLLNKGEELSIEDFKQKVKDLNSEKGKIKLILSCIHFSNVISEYKYEISCKRSCDFLKKLSVDK